MQRGDRVKKVGPKKGAGIGKEGVVEEVADDGRVRVTPADGTKKWKLQSANNFEKLGADAPGAAKEDTPAMTPHPKGTMEADGTPARPPPPESNDLLYDPKDWAIPGMCYQLGTVQKKPWNLESGAWYLVEDAAFPPEFAEEGRATRFGNRGTEVCPVKAIARAEGNDSVLWGRKTYTLEEWRQKLVGWQNSFPNIKRSDGSTPWETESFRSSQTSKVEIIKQCFDKCKRPTWPDTLKKASRDFLGKFRVDMWGNMICLPKTVPGGLADNESLCFFDVDHTFPFSRGGRSVLKNFEALQCCANRWVKSDRLVQTLDPREMLCGISAAQLLALVQWVEGGGEGDGKIKDRKIKDINALYGTIEGWLTVSPGHGNTFREFQKDVHGSSDSSVLRSYFVRKELARLLHLCVSGGEPLPAPWPQPSVAAAESPRSRGGHRRRVSWPPSPSPAYLKVRLCRGILEVWGKYTYAVKEELKTLKFRWDSDDGRKCWWRKVDDDQEKEQVQREVRQLAASRAFAYLLAA